MKAEGTQLASHAMANHIGVRPSFMSCGRRCGAGFHSGATSSLDLPNEPLEAMR